MSDEIDYVPIKELSPMRFSLVVATLGRDKELKELFASLASQTNQNLEVVVVDQNSDDRLAWTEQSGRFPFVVLRIRSDILQLSHARNLGLQIAAGDIVAFPDDDCTYPPTLLEKVDQAFRDRPDLGVQTGPVVTAQGRFGSGRWQARSGEISIQNVWLCSPSINIFIRRSLVMAIGGFDEHLGIGAEFGSGEDTDLVLRAVLSGWRGWYDVNQVAVHPDKALTPAAIKRAFTYGAGFGYILRKHHVPSRIWLNFLIRPLGGCITNLLRARAMNVRYYWCTLSGRWYGFRAYGKEATPAPLAAERGLVRPRSSPQ